MITEELCISFYERKISFRNFYQQAHDDVRRLAGSVLRKWPCADANADDLVQEMSIMLITAFDNYRPELGKLKPRVCFLMYKRGCDYIARQFNERTTHVVVTDYAEQFDELCELLVQPASQHAVLHAKRQPRALARSQGQLTVMNDLLLTGSVSQTAERLWRNPATRVMFGFRNQKTARVSVTDTTRKMAERAQRSA